MFGFDGKSMRLRTHNDLMVQVYAKRRDSSADWPCDAGDGAKAQGRDRIAVYHPGSADSVAYSLSSESWVAATPRRQ
jgi:hypothetical protein